MKKRRDPILRIYLRTVYPDKLKSFHFARVRKTKPFTAKFAMKFIWVLVVLAAVIISQPLSSSAAKKAQKGKFVVKQISNKLKTVCPSQKKNIKQVLSIVSSVDLTLRFTHSRISSLETAAKRLNKGELNLWITRIVKSCIPFPACSS